MLLLLTMDHLRKAILNHKTIEKKLKIAIQTLGSNLNFTA